MHEPGLPQVQKSPLGGVSPTPVPKAGVLPGIAWQAWTKFWAIGTPIAPWSKGLAPPDPATHVVFVGLHMYVSPRPLSLLSVTLLAGGPAPMWVSLSRAVLDDPSGIDAKSTVPHLEL